MSSTSSSEKHPTTATAFTFVRLTKVCTALGSESGCLTLPVDCPLFGSTHFSTYKTGYRYEQLTITLVVELCIHENQTT